MATVNDTDNLRTNAFGGPLRLKRKTTAKPSLNWLVIGPSPLCGLRAY